MEGKSGASSTIQAPIAYIKVVAVKKLVVELWSLENRSNFVVYYLTPQGAFLLSSHLGFTHLLIRIFTLKKLGC